MMYKTLCVLALFLNCTSYGGWLIHIERPWNSRVDDELVDSIEEQINLSADQRDLFDTLRRRHDEKFSMFVKRGRESLQSAEVTFRDIKFARETTDSEKELAQIAFQKQKATLASQQAKLDRRFFEQVEAILDDNQLKDWRQWKYQHLESRWQRLGSPIPGAEVDLERIIADLELAADPAARLEPILEQYRWKRMKLVNSAIKAHIESARNRWKATRRNHQSKEIFRQSATIHEWEQAVEKLFRQKIIDQQRALREPSVQLRNLNKFFSDAIASELPVDALGEFQTQVREGFYPHLYDSSNLVTQATEVSCSLNMLTEQQRAEIERIETDFNRQLKNMSDKEASVQEKAFVRWVTDPGDPNNLLPHDDESMKNYRDTRNALAKQIAFNIYELLNTPQQRQFFRQANRLLKRTIKRAYPDAAGE